VRLPRVRFTVRLLMVAVVTAAVAVAAHQALRREEGDPLIGFVIVASCVACLAAIAASRDLRRGPGGESRTVSRCWLPLRSLAVAVVLIGAPDAVFVAAYLVLSGGRWYTVPYVDGPRVLNAEGVILGAVAALGSAFLLRRALWPNRRTVRPQPVLTCPDCALAEV
jgi:hypothetical protein